MLNSKLEFITIILFGEINIWIFELKLNSKIH